MDDRIMRFIFSVEEIRGDGHGCWAYKKNCSECPWVEGSSCYFQRHRPGNWKVRKLEEMYQSWLKTHEDRHPDDPDGFESWAWTQFGLVKPDKVGRWEVFGNSFKCSRCDEIVGSWVWADYCPKCGAAMRGPGLTD